MGPRIDRGLCLFGVIACLAVVLPASQAAGASGLLFGPQEVALLRSRIAQEPYASMFASLQTLTQAHPWAPYDPSTNASPGYASEHARNQATMYMLTGDAAYAERSRQYVLQLVNDDTRWAVDSFRSLTRSMMAIGVAIAYDLCKDAWDAPTRQLVSSKLRDMGDSLIRNGGSGYNSYNNWRAVRFSGAGLSYLASDHAYDPTRLTRAFDEVAAYMRHMVTTDPDGMGWNAEGINYMQYPAQFFGPFNQAMLRHDPSKNLLDAAPGVPHMMWTQFVGTVPVNRGGRLGWMVDTADGHTTWNPQGAANLTFPNVDPRYLPGILWQYDRLVGAQGDGSWDPDRAGLLYALLYYPDDIQPRNPQAVWGLNYADPVMGALMWRNRYRDADDFVAWHRPKVTHPRGSHGGPDANGIRIFGLGTQWVSGSARYYTDFDARGESTVFPTDPTALVPHYISATGTLHEHHFFDDGSGWSIASGSSVGTTDHLRKFVVDYSGYSGADALFVINDITADGLWWRLNTPSMNDLELTDDGFVVTSPDGHQMVGMVLHGDRTTLRTGGFQRYWTAWLEGQPYNTNEWVDFRSDDGRFLVLLMVLPEGREIPSVTHEGDGLVHWIAVGEQTITLDASGASLSRWIINGDANRDGIVDLSDLALLARNWGLETFAGPRAADFNGDGIVDEDDLQLLRDNWQQGWAANTLATGMPFPEHFVPEPTTALLLLLAAPILLARRSRRHR